MKTQQKVYLFDRSYDIIESKMSLNRDPVTKVQTNWARCCVPADDISDISPWVMRGGQRTGLTFRTVWFNDDGSFKNSVGYDFHDAVCTDYWEEYDQKLNQPCLWFCFQAAAITPFNAAEEEAVKRLLE